MDWFQCVSVYVLAWQLALAHAWLILPKQFCHIPSTTKLEKISWDNRWVWVGRKKRRQKEKIALQLAPHIHVHTYLDTYIRVHTYICMHSKCSIGILLHWMEEEEEQSQVSSYGSELRLEFAPLL